MSAAFRLELRPSYPLAAAIVAAHAAAALSVALLMRDGAGAALAAALLALGGAAAWRRALLRGSGAVRALELQGEHVACELADGERVSVRAAPRRYVGRWLVTVALGAPLRRTLLVTADMAEPRAFRRLRIWALWGRLPGVADVQLAS